MKFGERYYENQAANIYHWIEENKHKTKNGVTSSSMFAHVVQRPGTDEHFTEGMPTDAPDMSQYYNLISRMKRKGYLIFEKERANGPHCWRVNEHKLPIGTVTYTGVKNYIPAPLAEPVEEPAPASQPSSPDPKAAQAFLDAELKAITIPYAMIKREGVLLELTDQNLYTIYQLGQILNANTEPYHEPETPQTQQPSSELPQLLRPESEPEDTPPLADSTDSAPF